MCFTLWLFLETREKALGSSVGNEWFTFVILSFLRVLPWAARKTQREKILSYDDENIDQYRYSFKYSILRVSVYTDYIFRYLAWFRVPTKASMIIGLWCFPAYSMNLHQDIGTRWRMTGPGYLPIQSTPSLWRSAQIARCSSCVDLTGFGSTPKTVPWKLL